MNERLQDIFEATIQSFIKTGEPVSSSWLFENHHFGIKPAMIRHELEELTELGLLAQPHHSSGRIPSDQGYEFYIQTILGRDELESNLDEKILDHFIDSDWPAFSALLSKNLGLLSVIDPQTENTVYKNGLETLLNQVNWETIEEVKKIIKDFEEIDNRLREVSKKIVRGGKLEIFIGQSPITDSRELAVVIESCNLENGPVVLAGVGPKRMNYKKVVKTFKGLKEIKNGRGKSKK